MHGRIAGTGRYGISDHAQFADHADAVFVFMFFFIRVDFRDTGGVAARSGEEGVVEEDAVVVG